jgi:hypothetical protein
VEQIVSFLERMLRWQPAKGTHKARTANRIAGIGLGQTLSDGEASKDQPVGASSDHACCKFHKAHRLAHVIKFVIKPTDRGWAIYRDDILVSTHPTRRQALKALGVLRGDLKAKGQRSMIRLELRAKPRSN